MNEQTREISARLGRAGGRPSTYTYMPDGSFYTIYVYRRTYLPTFVCLGVHRELEKGLLWLRTCGVQASRPARLHITKSRWFCALEKVMSLAAY